MYIIVDVREVELIAELEALGLDFEVRLLEVGDVIIKGIICIERKKHIDWLSSIKDGRYYEQVRNMMIYKERAWIIEKDDSMFEADGFNDHALIGVASAIIAKYGCTVVQVSDIKQTAYMIKCLSEKYGEEIEDLPLQSLKPCDLNNPEDLYKTQAFFLSGLPEHGDKTIESVLNTFGTPEAYFKAISESSILYTIHNNPKGVKGEITKVGGIGWKTLFKLKKVLSVRGTKCKHLRSKVEEATT